MSNPKCSLKLPKVKFFLNIFFCDGVWRVGFQPSRTVEAGEGGSIGSESVSAGGGRGRPVSAHPIHQAHLCKHTRNRISQTDLSPLRTRACFRAPAPRPRLSLLLSLSLCLSLPLSIFLSISLSLSLVPTCARQARYPCRLNIELFRRADLLAAGRPAGPAAG